MTTISETPSILKSYTELSQWDRERIKVGDPIACDQCGHPGVWSPDHDLAEGITRSEYIFPGEPQYTYVCDECETERQLAAESDSFEAEVTDLQNRINRAIVLMAAESRHTVYNLLQDQLSDFWAERLDYLVTEFAQNNEFDEYKLDQALLDPQDLDIDGYSDFVSPYTRDRLELMMEIELSDYDYDIDSLIYALSPNTLERLASRLIQMYVYDAVAWAGRFISDYLQNN